METLSEAFCINSECKDFGAKGLGNIHTRGRFGAENDKLLLYCRTCGKRFSQSRSTAFFGLRVADDTIINVMDCASEGAGIRETGRILNLDKDTVNRIVLKAEKHCESVLSNLLMSLKMGNGQIAKLISFIEKRGILKR